ncbi:MAG TPA: FAD-dependent oxidoreductase [Polyangiaceae bacterium]
MSQVVVIGAGIAGTAAALSAKRAGAQVTLVDGGPGASTLWSGAIGDAHVSTAQHAPALAEALGFVLVDATVVASTGYELGVVGHEAGLLAVPPKELLVGVVDCDRPGWDSEAIARDHPQRVVVAATIIRHVEERAMPDADFAARHDDPPRLGWLAERLRDGLSRADGRPRSLLLPPSLGIDKARAAELSKLVGVACGEGIGSPGGPPGLRFEHARDRALAAAGVAVVRGRASRVEASGGKWRVSLGDNGDGGIETDAVVVAAGGLVGGGLEYQSSEWILSAALPPFAREPFRCTIGGPLPLGAHGKPLELPGSLYGVPPESIAWPFAEDPLMNRVGVLCGPEGRVAHGLYAAGDLVADQRRDWLRALESGARAGTAAAREALTGTSAQAASASAASATRP